MAEKIINPALFHTPVALPNTVSGSLRILDERYRRLTRDDWKSLGYAKNEKTLRKEIADKETALLWLNRINTPVSEHFSEPIRIVYVAGITVKTTDSAGSTYSLTEIKGRRINRGRIGGKIIEKETPFQGAQREFEEELREIAHGLLIPSDYYTEVYDPKRKKLSVRRGLDKKNTISYPIVTLQHVFEFITKAPPEILTNIPEEKITLPNGKIIYARRYNNKKDNPENTSYFIWEPDEDSQNHLLEKTGETVRNLSRRISTTVNTYLTDSDSRTPHIYNYNFQDKKRLDGTFSLGNLGSIIASYTINNPPSASYSSHLAEKTIEMEFPDENGNLVRINGQGMLTYTQPKDTLYSKEDQKNAQLLHETAKCILSFVKILEENQIKQSDNFGLPKTYYPIIYKGNYMGVNFSIEKIKSSSETELPERLHIIYTDNKKYVITESSINMQDKQETPFVLTSLKKLSVSETADDNFPQSEELLLDHYDLSCLTNISLTINTAQPILWHYDLAGKHHNLHSLSYRDWTEPSPFSQDVEKIRKKIEAFGSIFVPEFEQNVLEEKISIHKSKDHDVSKVTINGITYAVKELLPTSRSYQAFGLGKTPKEITLKEEKNDFSYDSDTKIDAVQVAEKLRQAQAVISHVHGEETIQLTAIIPYKGKVYRIQKWIPSIPPMGEESKIQLDAKLRFYDNLKRKSIRMTQNTDFYKLPKDVQTFYRFFGMDANGSNEIFMGLGHKPEFVVIDY